MVAFQSRLRELRAKREGLKQSDVAAAVGVSTQSYSTYENGREPSYELLIKLADYFGCTTDYLLGVSNEPTRKENVQVAAKTTGLSSAAIDSLKSLDRAWVARKAYIEGLPHTSTLPALPSYVDVLNAVLSTPETLKIKGQPVPKQIQGIFAPKYVINRIVEDVWRSVYVMALASTHPEEPDEDAMNTIGESGGIVLNPDGTRKYLLSNAIKNMTALLDGVNQHFCKGFAAEDNTNAP